MKEEQIIINKTDKPHSFETGSAGARHKIYYNTPEGLQAHLKRLQELGLKDE